MQYHKNFVRVYHKNFVRVYHSLICLSSQAAGHAIKWLAEPSRVTSPAIQPPRPSQHGTHVHTRAHPPARPQAHGQ